LRLERGVMYCSNLLFKSDKKKFNFRRVESQKIGSHRERDLFVEHFVSE